MKADLDNLERIVGAQLRQAIPPISLPPEAMERVGSEEIVQNVAEAAAKAGFQPVQPT
jgi:hypothetical protein